MISGNIVTYKHYRGQLVKDSICNNRLTDTGVYMILCIANGKRYIGSAVSIKKRWREHRRQLENGNHHSRYLQRSWLKYGEEGFHFRAVLSCVKSSLLEFEQALLDELQPEYNSAPTAGSQLGYKHTDKTRLKMSESRRKGFSPMTGKTHTEEARKRISEGRAGKGCGARPPEWIESLKAAQKGRIKSPEHCAKIAATLKGHKQTPEQIEKRMQKIRGRKMPEGFAEAQSKRMKGKRKTSEHCISIGKASARLSDNQVRKIREMLGAGMKQKKIAADFGVDKSVISEIKTGKSYRWVD